MGSYIRAGAFIRINTVFVYSAEIVFVLHLYLKCTEKRSV